MKSLVASCLILILITLFTIYGGVYISKSIEKIIESTEQSEISDVAENIEASFLERKAILSLLLNDKDIDEIEDHLEDLKSAAESQSSAEMTKAKNRLISKLEQIRRLCAFNIDSIF